MLAAGSHLPRQRAGLETAVLLVSHSCCPRILAGHVDRVLLGRHGRAIERVQVAGFVIPGAQARAWYLRG